MSSTKSHNKGRPNKTLTDRMRAKAWWAQIEKTMRYSAINDFARVSGFSINLGTKNANLDDEKHENLEALISECNLPHSREIGKFYAASPVDCGDQISAVSLSGAFSSYLHQFLANSDNVRLAFALISNQAFDNQQKIGSPFTFLGSGTGQFVFWGLESMPSLVEVNDRQDFFKDIEFWLKHTMPGEKISVELVVQYLVDQTFKCQFNKVLWNEQHDLNRPNSLIDDEIRVLKLENSELISKRNAFMRPKIDSSQDLRQFKNDIFSSKSKILALEKEKMKMEKAKVNDSNLLKMGLKNTVTRVVNHKNIANSVFDYARRQGNTITAPVATKKSRIQTWASDYQSGKHHTPNTVITNLFEFIGFGGKDIFEHGPRDDCEYADLTDQIVKSLSLWRALGERDIEMKDQVSLLVSYLKQQDISLNSTIKKYYRRLNFPGQPVATLIAAILAWRLSSDGLLTSMRPLLQRRLSRMLRRESLKLTLASQGIVIEELDSLLFSFIAEDGRKLEEIHQFELKALNEFSSPMPTIAHEKDSLFFTQDVEYETPETLVYKVQGPSGRQAPTIGEVQAEITRLQTWKDRASDRWGSLNDVMFAKDKANKKWKELMAETRLSRFTLDPHCCFEIEMFDKNIPNY